MFSNSERGVRKTIAYIFLLSLLLSIKSSAQWFTQNSGTTNRLNSVYFLNPDTGFVAGATGTILKTTDGGGNWDLVSPGPPNAFNALVFPNDSTGYAFGTAMLILKTTDGGANWFSLNFGGDVLNFFSANFTNDSTGYAVGISGTESRIVKTTDAGNNWTVQSFDSITTLYSIHFPTVDTGYAVGLTNFEEAPILKTTDAGNSWFSQASGVGQSLRSVYFTSANIGYAVGTSGTILKTINGGNTWMTIDLGPGITPTLSSVFFPDATTGYAASEFYLNDGILKTTNAGAIWTFQNSVTSEPLNDLFFVDTNIGYVVGDNGIILKTTNGGGPVGIEDHPTVGNPERFYLEQNYPNPFNPTTTIRYQLSKSSQVKLTVYNTLGQEVHTLVNERQPAGQQSVIWDGTDQHGKQVSSGFYIYQIKAGEYVRNRRMLLIR